MSAKTNSEFCGREAAAASAVSVANLTEGIINGDPIGIANSIMWWQESVRLWQLNKDAGGHTPWESIEEDIEFLLSERNNP